MNQWGFFLRVWFSVLLSYFWRSFQRLSLPLENCVHAISLEEQELPGPLLGSARGGMFAFGAAGERRVAPSSASPVPALLGAMGRQGIGAAGMLRGGMGVMRGAELPPSIPLLPAAIAELGFDLAPIL